MSRIAPSFMPTAARGPMQGQPGSNGYWRRDAFQRPGTYTWTAKKTGKVKVQGLGAGGGGAYLCPGPSAAWGEKEFNVVAGEVYTIVTGSGGVGGYDTETRASATTTSISGPGLASPLVLTGATNAVVNNSGTAGVASGPWDKSFPGAKPTTATVHRGSPASASPFGPGIASNALGGAGWGGPANGDMGASSHYPGQGNQSLGSVASTPGLITRGLNATNSSATSSTGLPTADLSMRQIWDMSDADSAGASVIQVGGGLALLSPAGPGAGGSVNAQTAIGSTLGGGTGAFPNDPQNYKSGYGAGGVSTSVNNPTNAKAGNGGDALIYLFWDEVAA